jgi:hypothetical protein
MAIPKHDKHKEYARCAQHCLEMVPVAPDQEYRAIQRDFDAGHELIAIPTLFF